MPSASHLAIANGSALFVQLGYYEDIAALFLPSELTEDFDEYNGERYRSFFGYVATAQIIKDRLSVRGITSDAATGKLDEAIAKATQTQAADDPDVDETEADVRDSDFQGQIGDRVSVLSSMRTWIEWDIESNDFLPAKMYDDPRVFDHLDVKHHFRLLLDIVPGDSRVALDLTSLKNDTCCIKDLPDEPAEAAAAQKQEDISGALPLIVLTEGSSDSSALEQAMKVTHPHLQGFVRFMDFSQGSEGSVSVLVKTLKTMVGAGIPNRIVAIADNDAAARREFLTLKSWPEASNVRIVHYPDLEWLRSYPTYDVEGKIINLDINGRAGSLEMYYGRDILTKDGALIPVRWTSYEEKIGTYQGVVDSKSQLTKNFQEKVRRRLSAGQDAPDEDWTGMRAILDVIVHAFD
ncbi:hypothetical protein [Arthrobacter silvisoli]|uniref:hypothetical protein n=1 Tax=Arthrobacter silvisoli TaxID=2291022 RepID=UPI00109BABC9|nr:hypothetical protein [Arthrobacter silvisoli]